MVMEYTACSGVESEIANCSGFDYNSFASYTFSFGYCSPERTAGVKCLSKPSI